MLTNPQDLMGSLTVAATAFIASIPLFAKEPIAVFKNQIAAWQRAQLVRSAFDHVQAMDPRRQLIEEPGFLSMWSRIQAYQCNNPAKKIQWKLIAKEALDLASERASRNRALEMYSENYISQKEDTFDAWDQSIDKRSLALYERAEALLVLDEDSQSANANEG